MKTSELTGAALDLAVGMANGWVTYPEDSKEHGDTYHLDPERAPFGPIRSVRGYQPSTNWNQGGPIIEREQVAIFPTGDGTWRAQIGPGVYGVQAWGPTPLIAAMRAYVKAKLGPEVELPWPA